MSRARILADYVSSGDELAAVATTANAALPKAGGAMTGAITTNSTFDGIDIATRDAILTSTTTLATAAAPKASPAFTGTPTGITAAHLEAGVLPSDVTGGSGLTKHAYIGQTCRMWNTTTITGSASGFITDWTEDYNQNATLFTPVVSGGPQGIQCLVAGTYLFAWCLYTNAQSDTGYIQQYLAKGTTGLHTRIDNSYEIHYQAHTDVWTKSNETFIYSATANDIFSFYWNAQSPMTINIVGGINHSWITSTFLHD